MKTRKSTPKPKAAVLDFVTVAIDAETHERAKSVTGKNGNGQTLGFFCNRAILSAVETEELRLHKRA